MKTKYTTMSASDKNAYKNKQTVWQENNMLKYRMLVAKDRAKKKKIAFDITEDFLYELWDLQKGKCYYSKIDLSQKIKDLHSVSIDRKDSNIGYTTQNTVLCSSIVNSMKNDLDINKFKEVVNILHNNL
jgi:hypothetical protein